MSHALVFLDWPFRCFSLVNQYIYIFQKACFICLCLYLYRFIIFKYQTSSYHPLTINSLADPFLGVNLARGCMRCQTWSLSRLLMSLIPLLGLHTSLSHHFARIPRCPPPHLHHCRLSYARTHTHTHTLSLSVVGGDEKISLYVLKINLRRLIIGRY